MTTLQLGDPELAAIIQLLRHDRGADASGALAALSGIDFRRLTSAAAEHRVTVLLHRRLRALPPGSVPESSLAELDVAARSAVEGAFRSARQLREILAALRAHQIRALPLKGPALSALVYGDVTARGASQDLDLLVRPAAFLRAVSVLEANGYRRFEVHADAGEERWYTEACLVPTAAGVSIDLHTELVGNVATRAMNLDAVFARAKTHVLFQTPVDMLPAEELLLYLCIHAGKSTHLWNHLVWACDVAELIVKTPALDWERTFAIAQKLGAGRRLMLGAFLAWRLLGAPLPAAVQQRLQKSRLVALLARLVVHRMRRTTRGRPEPRFVARILSELAVRESRGERRGYLRIQLSPNFHDRRWTSLPPSLRWLGYAIRPLRLLVAYGLKPLGARVKSKLRRHDRT